MFFTKNCILAIGDEAILIDARTKTEYRIKEEINFFDTKYVTEEEQCILLCYYYGITNKCIEIIKRKLRRIENVKCLKQKRN